MTASMVVFGVDFFVDVGELEGLVGSFTEGYALMRICSWSMVTSLY